MPLNKKDWQTYSCKGKLTQAELFLYEEELDWGESTCRDQFVEWSHYSGVSSNSNLIFTDELIVNFKNRWDWVLLGMNIDEQNKSTSEPYLFDAPFLDKVIETIPPKAWDYWFFNNLNIFNWSDSLITYLISKEINFHGKFPFTEEYILENEDVIDFKALSWNYKVKWNHNLLNRYKSKLDWNQLSEMDFPWDYEIIKAFAGYLDFGCSKYKAEEFLGEDTGKQMISLRIYTCETFGYSGLSRNSTVKWSETLIMEYKDRWDFYGIASNNSFPWRPELMEILEEIIDWNLVYDLYHNKYPDDTTFNSLSQHLLKEEFERVLIPMFEKHMQSSNTSF